VVDGTGLENRCTAPDDACKLLDNNGLGLSFWGANPDCSKTVVIRGELAEWLMAPVLKTGIRETVSGVRIPHSPPPSQTINLAEPQLLRKRRAEVAA
jgi:hypothetical protein